MQATEIIAQIIGIIAMGFNILSYQGKKQKTVIVVQLIGAILFATNYLMLGATIGGILNLIAAVRAVVFYFRDKFHAGHILWFISFIASFVIVYILNFTILGKEPSFINLMLELLPVIGMIALTVGFRLKNASDIRKCGLISAPSWLIYNIAVMSWGAIICEVLTLISIVLGILRHDKSKKART